MQPIKTTNAMNPAPAKGIESFPTPVIDDVVIAEVVNAWKGDYQKLEYGTLWRDVSHAPNQGSFPEHKLVFQQPTSEDGQWIKRIWVNDRVNQDSYNYAIKYSAGSQQHPIYIRNYVVPRETYTPLPDGTPDPLFPIALLVDEEANRIEGELDSKYVSVTRVYETLPGPQVPTKRYNDRGDLETVLVQTVPPFTPPDPDGLLVTGSQVVQEEMGKGVKTTSTVQDHSLLQIKEKKEGLLGETITTDDIVAPSTNPDELSQTVVSSVVEQFSATKARKRTTTASGPKSLTQKSKDGKLLGDVTSTQSIVAPSTSPDAVSSSILSSEIKQVDSGKAVKTNVVLNSTPTLSGNQNEDGLLGNKQVVESIVPAGAAADALSQTVVSSVVEAIDSVRSKKTTITSNGPTTLSGKEKKEGLLGETTVTESIVSAQTDADALSQTVVSSSVQPIDSAKSKKTTIIATGPTSLTKKSNEGKLLSDLTVTRSIVAPNSDPDAVSQSVLSSEVEQIDSGKAQKSTVRINSNPTLTSKKKGAGLMGNTRTVESIVPADTEADILNTVILESTVESINSSISKKSTTSQEGPTSLVGGEFKEGLLGQTVITESIVTASSTPDQLSQTVVSSTIEPIDSAKSKKTTITSTGPKSLTQKSKDGKLLGDVTSTQSIVSPSSSPDAVSSTVLSSEVRQVDSGKAVKTNIVLNSTPKLSGNQNDGGLLGNKLVVESIVPAGTLADQLSETVVSSSVEAVDSVRSKKTTITSTGPTKLSGVQNKDGLLGQTEITESIVGANSPADPVSLQVISSVVESIDSAKSKKTTIKSSGPTSLSGKEYKGGLLGNTVKTESIVAANSNPDALSISVIQSQVEPMDNAKSKKTTITSDGPTYLTSRTLSDSPTGAVNATKINFIVNPNQVPVNSLTTLKYDINAIDSAKSEAEIVAVDEWPEVRGIEFDDTTGLPIPYTEKVISPSEYNDAWEPFINTNYKPIDEYKAIRKSYNTEEIQRYYIGYLSVIETPVQITLPDKLLDVIAYTARDYSEGKNVTNSNNVGGDSYGYTSGGGFRSAGSISSDIYFKIEKGFDGYIDGLEVTLFTESLQFLPVPGVQLDRKTGKPINIPPVTKSVNAKVLAELQGRLPNENIQLWPTLKKISQNILVFTGGKSRTESSTTSEDVSINGFANSQRDDKSYDIDTNVNSVIVPDALYDTITIKEEKFGPIIPDDLQITGGVFPKTLQATNPPKFPVGNYLIRSDASIYRFGLVKITAVIARVTEDFV
jgi:hypothetical protein